MEKGLETYIKIISDYLLKIKMIKENAKEKI